METEKKIEIPLPPKDPITAPAKKTYYTNVGRKISDFCLGFFGIILIGYLGTLIDLNLLGINGIFYLLIYILVIIGVFKIQRKFIAIGILAPLILLLLIFGGCVFLVNFG